MYKYFGEARRENLQLNHKKSKLLKGEISNSQNEIYEINYLLELNQKIMNAINRGLIIKKNDLCWTNSIKEDIQNFLKLDLENTDYKEFIKGSSLLELGLHTEISPYQKNSLISGRVYQTHR